MTSDIGSGFDAGSPRVPLSPVDEVPKLPEAGQNILYNEVPNPPEARRNISYNVPKSPKSPNAKRSILYRNLQVKSPSRAHLKSSRHGKSATRLSLSPSRRGKQHLLEQISKEHAPYASRPAPLELRLAARVSGQGFKPEFTAEEIQEVCFLPLIMSSDSFIDKKRSDFQRLLAFEPCNVI